MGQIVVATLTPFGMLYWLLWILMVLFAGWMGHAAPDSRRWWWGGNAILMIMLFLIGWRVYPIGALN